MVESPSDRAVLSVDLGALVSNWRLLKSKMAGDIAATVKANGYGLGVEQVSIALHNAGCDTFFVATLAEAIALRRILRDAQIYVFSGLFEKDVPLYKAHAIHPVLNTFKQVKTWAKTGPEPGAAIHVDTGMNRLGCDAQDTATLIANPHVVESAGAKLLMSHLACADTPEHWLNAEQVKRFSAVAQALPFLKTSLANSVGTMNTIRARIDLARPGIALYGGSATPDVEPALPLKPVASVTAPILQCRFIQAGDPVGYGASYVAERSMDVATVGIGYADGLPRSISGKGHVYLDEARCPILGRVSMDSIVVDISALGPQPQGTAVEILGRVGIDDMARWAGTISYEVLTGLGARLEKTYTQS